MIKIVKLGITNLNVDVIVNAANSQLQAGGGVCGAIFKDAGYSQLQAECKKIGYCKTGSAVITSGCNLKAKYIIHAVGPIWHGGNNGEEDDLRNAYISSLKLSKEKGCNSIAFPLISSGIYGYPVQEAWEIALSTAREFLDENSMDIYFAEINDEKYTMGQEILSKMQTISKNYNFTFFWNIEQENEEFSNWYHSEFTVEGIRYSCVEQYMMAKKALVFKDYENYILIMNSGVDPAACKTYRRAVRNFDSKIWADCAEEVVYNANFAKFSQNSILKRKLLDTKDSILVEASPYDAIWGIKLAADNPDAKDPSKWQGQNLMGKILMKVREVLSNI